MAAKRSMVKLSVFVSEDLHRLELFVTVSISMNIDWTLLYLHPCTLYRQFINVSDVNECQDDNGGCEHLCFNSPGSYYCQCKDGFRLSDNLRSCTGNQITKHLFIYIACFTNYTCNIVNSCILMFAPLHSSCSLLVSYLFAFYINLYAW